MSDKKDFSIVLTPEEIKVIGAALMELPYKFSAPVIDTINHQVVKQQADETKSESETKD